MRRELLSSAQRAQLLALPTSLRELEKRYSFTPSDLDGQPLRTTT